MGHFIFIHFFFSFHFHFFLVFLLFPFHFDFHIFSTHIFYIPSSLFCLILVVFFLSSLVFTFHYYFLLPYPPQPLNHFYRKKKIHFTIFFFQYSILFLFHFLLICFWLSNCFSSVSTMFHSEMGPVQPRYQSLR